MTTVKALEMILELAEGNMLAEEHCEDDAVLKREARKQDKAHEKVQSLITLLKSR